VREAQVVVMVTGGDGGSEAVGCGREVSSSPPSSVLLSRSQPAERMRQHSLYAQRCSRAAGLAEGMPPSASPVCVCVDEWLMRLARRQKARHPSCSVVCPSAV